MYITKKQQKIIESLIWKAKESGFFDRDFSDFLDFHNIEIEDIEDLQNTLQSFMTEHS